MTEQSIHRRLHEMRDHLTPPPGCTCPEITDGKLVIMMSRGRVTSSPRWTCATSRPAAQLPDGMVVAEATDTDDASPGTLRIPGLLVVSRAAMETKDRRPR
ncbi:hypothetical protein AB0K92_03145 [Streptomyces sp. NPDC052687]|uniref:hypothetical protein n=1 Tax=Streptomyces sp. NPDC052687 TaxID=3154759 RepID=UPI003441AE65